MQGEYIMEVKVIKGKNDICELCKEYGELRPYGPNGEWICFKCGMQNVDTTKKQFAKLSKGDLIIDVPKTIH